MKEKNIDKFYDFINMYNLIIKYCATKKRKYDIKVYYLSNKLYFRISDSETMHGIFDEYIECNLEDATMIENMITSEFILNHPIMLSSFANMNESDFFNYFLTNELAKISYINGSYYNENNKPMLIHELVSSIFTLRIYYYDGINEIVENLHNNALNKVNDMNQDINLVKVKQ